jgi:hypothetical protein
VDPRAALVVAAGRLIVVAQGDAGPGGQLLDGLHEVEVLDLAHEGDHVALGTAPEAVVEAQLGVEGKRRALLRVKRAQAHPPGSNPTQGQVLAGHRHEVGGGADPGDVLVDYPHVTTLRRLPATAQRLRRRRAG